MRAEDDFDWSYVLPVAERVDFRELSPREYLIRFGLGAAISVVAGIIGLTVGARFGGCFLAFPSILPASLTLIQQKEGVRVADRNAIGAVLGAAGIVVFAMIGEASFRSVPPYLALPCALAGWLITACGLYAMLAWFRPDTCDRRKD